jgi:hypothetical protein
MADYRIMPDIVPNDKYEKAKGDLIQAIYSFRALNPQQQQQLAYEILGAETMAAFINMMQNYKQ